MSVQYCHQAPYAVQAGKATCKDPPEVPASALEPPGLLRLRQWTRGAWSSLQRWFVMNTFAPPWLPRRWQHPAIGYLVAVLLQLLITGCDLLLLLRYPNLQTHHLPYVLGVVVVALNWGVGPSLVATITGAVLIYSVVLFTPASWSFITETDVAELTLFLLICGTISAIASQTQWARLHAEQVRRAAEDLAASLTQEQAHSELERQRLQVVLEVLPVGVCLVNAAGQVVARNQAEMAIRGRDGAGDERGWANTGQLLLPEEWAIARAVWQGEETRGEEMVISTPDGHPRTFLSAAVPIRDATGAIVGAVGALLDISERKQLEASQRQAEREQLLRERAEAEAHALALREANQRMDAFLGLASHELKTPLTNIKLHLQLLQRGMSRILSQQPVATEALITALEHLQRQCLRSHLQVDRLDRLVNDLLDISRIQADRLTMRESPADLRAIVRAAIEEQRSLVPHRIIHLQPLPEQPIPVQVDAGRIGQVVTNYLTNALKYSQEDQPVTVGIQEEGVQARVWVQDRGPGISAEEQAHIWERFHRVPGIEVQDGSGIGLGLGLHISRTIIERHGGQVGIESAPGSGSTFWFSLPLASEAPPEELLPPS
jgi:signal transduction histidine kinase